MIEVSRNPFLTAEWRHIVVLNFQAETGLLSRFLPRGTEIDLWNGRALVSIVGFLFQDVRVLSRRIPFHTQFEEVNLRFYVRRRINDEWRRGVVFVRELVPRVAVAILARLFFYENYRSCPMSHEISAGEDLEIRYRWRFGGRDFELRGRAEGKPRELAPGSLDEFVLEHYWGYARQPGGGTLEYRVEHPRWRTWAPASFAFEGDVAALYGDAWAKTLTAAPYSAVLAEGSPVRVFRGERI